ncbi:MULTISPECIES: malate dehydrogenase [Planktothricoides]|uniref:Malate dehydrogenase n=2 Tax=Planktothricoides raciborskii TaxID=132608 RepID=A0AAU8JHE3_9CYAN|nr:MULTISPECIES: malate dehydrogenase [Planktothricoides]KOR36436.1 malate dehydrogenase [Planktothricoides sp. SR001]MBD2546494.1 malate dehydrogenase [Planktothricoides raciborskii FACHB-1370]MBD2584163.1 malate dehydrogenase [Planktothricoides raciborskii FACHB-1261]
MTSFSLSPSSLRGARVSVIGAGRVGSTLAQRLVEKNIADVVLVDIVEGMPQGIALDLMEARGVERHDRQIIGTNDYADTSNSDIVVITAGLARKPGMSREDLLKTNAKIVVDATKKALERSPNTILILVTNPLDVMTYLAWEASGLPTQRVMGMAGVLDAARFQAFISMELGVSIQDIHTMVLGNHGDLMVPIPRYCTVNGVPLTELMDTPTIERLVDRTRTGGTEIVNLMKTGSAYFAPASSTCLMCEAILQNQSRVLPVAAYLQGEYGINDVFLGMPCQLGSNGVEKILKLDLTDSEKAALSHCADTVRENIDQAKAVVGSI